jgi:hypothetical protein
MLTCNGTLVNDGATLMSRASKYDCAFDEAGDEHGAEGFRQRVDGALEQHADFALSHGRFRIEYASVTCWAIHSALGCAATPSHRMRLRSYRRTSNPYSSRNEIVGTTKKVNRGAESAS